jgi:hypothetical protein
MVSLVQNPKTGNVSIVSTEEIRKESSLISAIDTVRKVMMDRWERVDKVLMQSHQVEIQSALLQDQLRQEKAKNAVIESRAEIDRRARQNLEREKLLMQEELDKLRSELQEKG